MNLINYFVPVAHAANITTVQGLIDVIAKIAGYFSVVFYILAGIYLILAAFSYLLSSGDPKKIEVAKTRVIYAAVAIAVAILSTSMKVIIDNLLTV